MFQYASLFCNFCLSGQLLPKYDFCFCSSGIDETSKYKSSFILDFLNGGGQEEREDANKDLALKKR